MAEYVLKKHVRGNAYVRHNGKCIYFGKFGTEETERRFKEWCHQRDLEEKDPDRVTILTLSAQFMDHAAEHYQKDGEPTASWRTSGRHCALARLSSAIFGFLTSAPNDLKRFGNA